MSEVKRYAAELDQMYLLGDNEKIDLTVFERFFVEASDYEALQSRLDAAEAEVQRQKQTIAGMNDAHWKVVRQLAERDAVLRETADSLRCSKVFPALLESIDALLSSAEPVKCKKCGSPCTHDDDAYDECRFCNAEVPSSSKSMTAKGGDEGEV